MFSLIVNVIIVATFHCFAHCFVSAGLFVHDLALLI